MRFWKKKHPQTRDIDQLIFEVAESGLTPDINELLSRLRDVQIYSPILESNVQAQNGQRIRVEPDMRIQLPIADLGGVQVIVFYVHKDDQRLGARFVGLSLDEVFTMIENAPEIRGFILYNRNISYFGVDKLEFPRIRAQQPFI
jgi:hypothetical protein